MSRAPRTVIELSDRTTGDDPVCHKTREIRINGTPVLIEKDGIEIEYGDEITTVVVLRILPTEIHFNHKQIQEADNGKA